MSEPSADVRQLAEDVIGDLRDEIRDGRETKPVRGRFVTCSYQAMTAVLDCYDQLRAERDEARADALSDYTEQVKAYDALKAERDQALDDNSKWRNTAAELQRQLKASHEHIHVYDRGMVWDSSHCLDCGQLRGGDGYSETEAETLKPKESEGLKREKP